MIELKRNRSRLCISPTIWMLTLELAKLCGWNPAGTAQKTVADEESGHDTLHDVRHLMAWQTAYMSNDGQTVNRVDAEGLANALDRAAVDADRILRDWSEGRISPPSDIRNKPGGFRWFSTLDGKDHLQSIAEFCRGGDFQIF